MGLLRFSKRVVAQRAVTYAVNHVDEFAETLAAKVDIPVLDEEEEKAAFRLALQGGLEALEKVLSGAGLAVDVPFSKRQLAESAIELARGNAGELIDGLLDDHGWQGTLQGFAEKLLEGALAELDAWVASTPLLD